jgi:hypothetical protein
MFSSEKNKQNLEPSEIAVVTFYDEHFYAIKSNRKVFKLNYLDWITVAVLQIGLEFFIRPIVTIMVIYL